MPTASKRDFEATPEPGPSEPAERRGAAALRRAGAPRPPRCTGTCGSSATACSSRGPSRRASRPTRSATTWRSTPRTIRSSTSTSAARSRRASTAPASMKIWDTGTYETHKFRDDEVMVTFHGERLHGRYVLFRTRGDDWMIHRMDPPEDPEREPMPEHVEPMLATHRRRCRATRRAGRSRSSGTACGRSPTRRAGTLRLESRNGRDITPRYPELRELGPGARRARGGARRRGGRLRRTAARRSRSSRAACT